MDDADRASEHEEKYRALSLQARKPELKPCGFCYYCNELIVSNKLFCDIDCRDDYEKERKARRLSGN